jgi:hypothetical protein
MAFDQFRGRALSPETIAVDTDTSISTVHRWISAGVITAVKLGYRMTRVDGDSLADFLTSRLSAPRPARGKALKQSAINKAA